MRSRIAFILILCAVVVLAACSGGQGTANNNNGSTFSSSKPSTVQVSIGDDPADRVVSLSLTVNSVTLVTDSGTQAALVTSPTTVEISSLAGTTTPLATVNVPAGTYTKAVIALGGATLTAVDPNTGVTVQKTFPAPTNTFTITLNPAFVSDGSALVVNVNLDLHRSVAVDANGNLTFNPLFLVSHGKMSGPPSGEPPDPETGGIEHVLGVVTGVNGNSFTIMTAIGRRSLTFATNGSTVFKNISGISSLQKGMLVIVGGQAQADGSLLALGVVVMNGMPNATGAVGIVGKTTGTPVTQFTLIAQGLISMSAMPVGMNPVPNAAITVNVSSGTAFRVDSDNVDMTGLTLKFDASTLSPAQAVEVDSAAAVSTATSGGSAMGMPLLGTFNAAQVQLEPQPLAGTISNLTANSFTLTLPSDSFFATLTQATTVTVYKQGGTQVSGTLANGQKVVVRGLLFNNNGYQMVATRVGALQ